jgi:hypothetical protein
MLTVRNENVKSLLSLSLLIVSILIVWHAGFRGVNASTSASGLTGKYGCMYNRNVNGFQGLYRSFDSTKSVALVATAIINYDSKTISTLSGEVSNWDGLNPEAQNFTSSGSFSESAVSNHSGAYEMAVTLTDPVRNKTGTMKFITIPVNSGNTILVTEIGTNTSSAPWTGVCQKI